MNYRRRLMSVITGGIGILYDHGDLYSDITGGWIQTMTGASVLGNKMSKLALGTDSMYSTGTIYASGTNIPNVYRCTGLIDVTRYSTLNIEYSRSGISDEVAPIVRFFRSNNGIRIKTYRCKLYYFTLY